MHLVLTGSSTGIGRALAERLLSRGHHVWGLARSDQSDFAALYPAFRHTRCDVSDYSAVAAAVSAYAAPVEGQGTRTNVLMKFAPEVLARETRLG